MFLLYGDPAVRRRSRAAVPLPSLRPSLQMGAATPSKRARTTAAPITGMPQKLKNMAAGTLFTDQIATPRKVLVASDLSWTPEKIEQRPRPRRASAKVRLPADLVRGFLKDWDAMEDLLSYVLRSNPSAKSRYSPKDTDGKKLVQAGAPAQ